MIVYCYSKCSTCKKALQWLDDHHITYQKRHIVEECPSAQELTEWIHQSGRAAKTFFTKQQVLLWQVMELKHIYMTH